MKAYKGFDHDMKCRDFQYEEGEVYETNKAVLCETGFHACKMPLDVFRYYPPSSNGRQNKFHEVELEDVCESEDSGDTKVCAKKIKIGAELDIAALVKAQIAYVKEHCDEGKGMTAGDGGAATAGDGGAATAGYGGVATAGDRGAATAGNRGAATAGYGGVATAGYGGAATAGNRGAATAGNRGAATSRGSSAVGENGVACARGNGCRVKGGLGSVLVLVEENSNSYDIQKWAAFVVDGVQYKPDVWYELKDGEFVEVKE